MVGAVDGEEGAASEGGPAAGAVELGDVGPLVRELGGVGGGLGVRVQGVCGVGVGLVVGVGG